MTLIYVLLIAHFVGDFLCQSDWMALNKSKDWGALLAHVTVYLSVLTILLGIVDGVFPLLLPQPWSVFGGYLLVNAAAHFVQDAITSRITTRLWFIDLHPESGTKTVDVRTGEQFHFTHLAAVHGPRRHWFFVVIGLDQLLHYLTLFATAEWMHLL